MTVMTEPVADFEDSLIHLFIDVSGLAPAGEEIAFTASAEDRARLERAFGIEAVEALEATLTVKPFRRSGASVKGEVRARVVQQCIITLEPVEQSFSEEVDLKFVPAGGDKPREPVAELDIDPTEADPPEVFEAGRIDLGAVIAEHFALGIDPYPRKEGAHLPVAGVDDADGGDAGERSPFRVLAGLKGDGES